MKFHVPDMSCGHCTAAIEKALKSADAGAEVTTDLTRREVSVVSGLDQEAVLTVLAGAGYPAAVIA